MDGDIADLPNDVDALKAALAVERAKMREVIAERDAGAAELAVARAKASEDLAMIAHQKLRIAKLERQLYGPRSERSERLIDQLALQFEELAASATEDELAAESAVAKTTTVAAFTRKRPYSALAEHDLEGFRSDEPAMEFRPALSQKVLKTLLQARPEPVQG